MNASRTIRAWTWPGGIAAALLSALFALSGCGSNDEGVTHIRGSSATITKPMLDHWMRAVVATDFRVSIGTKAPRGLASEPSNDAECTASAKKIVPRDPTGRLKLTDAEIVEKCHELHQAIKTQAITYLLSAQWTMLEAKQLAVPLTEAELHKEFLRYRKELFAGDAKFQAYMKERQLELSDVLYQLKRNVLVTRILPKFKARVNKAGGGEKLYAKLALERYRHLISKTSCEAGYVTEDCKEYRAPATPPQASNVILEAFVQGLQRS